MWPVNGWQPSPPPGPVLSQKEAHQSQSDVCSFEITKACPLPCLNPGASRAVVVQLFPLPHPTSLTPSLRGYSWEHSSVRCLHANLESQSLFPGEPEKETRWGKNPPSQVTTSVRREGLLFSHRHEDALLWLSSNLAQPESWTRSTTQCWKALAQTWGGNRALQPSDLGDSRGEYICGKKPTSSWRLIPAD